MDTRIAVAVGIVAVLAAAFAAPRAAMAANVPVDIVSGAQNLADKAFSPNPVEAKKGDTVVWTNKDSTIHTATSGTPSGGPTGMFGGTSDNPKLIAPSTTQSFTFTEDGDFPYFCILHPTMVGLVKVAEGGGDGGGNATQSQATATVDGKPYIVTAMSTSKLTAVTADPAKKMVTLTFDKAGKADVTLPSSLITGIAKQDGVDDVEPSGNATKIEVTVPEGQTSINVMGTFVVPEFPLVAALILAITISAVVAYTRLSKGSFGNFRV